MFERASIKKSRGLTLLFRIWSFEEALSDFNKCIEIDPKHADSIDYRGQMYRLLGRFDKALLDFTRAIELKPNNPSFAVNRGAVYVDLGRDIEAVKEYNRAVKLDPNYAMAYNNLGDIYYKQERFDDAIVNFTKAIEILPNLGLAHVNRAETYLRTEQYEKAIKDFEAAILLNFKGSFFKLETAFLGIGNAYFLMNKFEEAVPYYSAAIQHNSSFSPAYQGRGNCYLELNHVEAAIKDFSTIIQVNPEDPKGYILRGQIYSEINRKIEAYSDFLYSIDIDKTNSEGYLMAGIELLKNGLGEQAFAFIKIAAQLGNPLAVQLLYKYYDIEGDLPDLQLNEVQVLAAAFELANNFEEMRTVSIHFSILGDIEGIQAFSKLIDRNASLEDKPILNQKLSWLRDIYNSKPLKTD